MDDLMERTTEPEKMEIECSNTIIRKCRLTRKHAMQQQQLCAKEERNASIKKVRKKHTNNYIL